MLTVENANTAAVVNAVRYAVKTRPLWITFVTENEVTRENVTDTAKELATLAYPNDEDVQTVKDADGRKTRTRYGNAVQAAAAMMRKALDDIAGDEETDETPKAAVLRVSLSGEGGGSTVVPADHPLYASIVALLAGE